MNKELPLTEQEIRRQKRTRRRVVVAAAGGGMVAGTLMTGGIGPAVVAGSLAAAAAITRTISNRRERSKDRRVKRALINSEDAPIDVTIPTTMSVANNELLVEEIIQDSTVDDSIPPIFSKSHDDEVEEE